MAYDAQQEINRRLFEALSDGGLEDVALAIKDGADINALIFKDEVYNKSGMIVRRSYRPLMCAQTDEQRKLLIDAGANIEASVCEDYYGVEHNYKLLMRAQTAEQTKWYIEAGADVNAINNEKETALMFAQTAEQTKLLIEAGADINAKDRNGKTVLMYAVERNDIDSVNILLMANADINKKDNNGKTILMYAQTPKMTNKLLKQGVDVNATDNNGQTALMYAMTAGQTQLLLRAGADIDATDNYHRTAFDYAEIKDNAVLGELMHAKKEQVKAATHEHIEIRKAQFLKSRQLRKELEKRHPEEKVSDAACADEIARDVISSKDKRTITPEVAMDIRNKKAFEK